MKQINYQLTNALTNNLIQLEVEKALLKNLTLSKNSIEKLETIQNQYNVFHVSPLLNLEMTLKGASKIDFEAQPNNPSILVLKNFVEITDKIRNQNETNYVDINVTLMQEIHQTLAQGFGEGLDNRIRSNTTLASEFEQWLEFIDNTIAPNEIRKEVDVTIDWYKNNITRIHPIIRIAVAMYRLIRIAPFNSFNQLTIIALTDFLLQKNDYVLSTHLSVSRLFDRNAHDFKRIWKSSAQSPSGNITPWIEHFANAIANEVKDMREKAQKLFNEENKPAAQPFLNLNKRQLKILKYLQTIPTVKREDYVQMFDVSTMTAFRDLNELLERKLLRTDGKGRATKYLLANK